MLTNNPLVRRIVRLALEEDIGTGDATTESVIPAGTRAVARVVAKAPGVLAGLPVARLVLAEVDPLLQVTDVKQDGDDVAPGDVVLTASGSAQSLLVAERTLLDFVMRLSGVATATRRFVQALAGSKTVLLDTRKTTPGLRVLEKYATRVGGARNHRMGLDSGVLIKNNHLALVPDLKDAIRRARTAAPILCRVEVEVRTMEQVKRAVEAGADVLLLDHMTPDQVSEAIDYCDWKVKLEVSGNVDPALAAAAAHAGVDYVSTGAVTHSAPWLDFGMYLNRRTPMLAAIDVGNTNIVVGVFDGAELKARFRVATRQSATADEYALLLDGLLRMHGLGFDRIDGVCAASVVPQLADVFAAIARDRVPGVPMVVVGPEVDTGITVRYEPPRDVGADRIVNAVAAWQRHRSDLVIVDFGTATTFDAVTAQGEYLGGVIVPGVTVSLDALFSRTAKLPKVELSRPPLVIGRTTVQSIQSGAYWGYRSMVEGLVARMRAELTDPVKVVATGGLASLVCQGSPAIDEVDPDLTLHGLRLIWERNLGQ